VWAVARLVSKQALVALAARYRPAESDPAVDDEWAAVLEDVTA
jgi:hypothetical protein